MLSGAALLAAVPAAARADEPAWWDVSAHAPSARALTAKIDRHLAEGWRAAGVEPAPPATDAEFLRRVYLDLAGRVPSVAEARRFLRDRRADKRARLIDELLDGPRYPAHFSRVWRALWLPEAASSIQGIILKAGFESWLRKNLAANTPYDKLVYEMLTIRLPSGRGQDVIGDAFAAKPTPVGFYLAKEGKPENLAAGTSRLFLGIKLECAQCHNHPFNDWKREQFWSMAAFFSGIDGKVENEFTNLTAEKIDSRSIKIPTTETVIQASFLDGSKPRFKDKVGARVTLAEWVTAAENPFFARAAVNRVWAYFFGGGLTDPVDEMIGGESKSHHPALLDELARQFAASGFDMKFLLRSIANSRAYQLTSAGKVAEKEAGQFARMAIRGLTAEQLYDSIAQATGYNEPASAFPISFVPGSKPSLREQFMTRFANATEKSTDPSTTILHALALMNGKLIGEATSLERSETLSAVLNSPFLDTGERLEVLYLSTVARPPRAEELSRLTRYLETARTAQRAGTAAQRYNRAVADVFWMLLNSGEFILNH
jgi:hypothetical protein